MEWLKENWFKLASLGIVLIIGLGYVNFLNTKEENRQAEESRKQLQASIEAEKQLEAEKKKYQADRKSDCLDIYKTEQEQWSNVEGWNYNEVDDTCYIIYREGTPKTKDECLEEWSLKEDEEPSILGDNSLFYREYNLCIEGRFRNPF